MEALTLTSVQYNFLHKYLDKASYTRPSPLKSKAPLDLLIQMSKDDRFSKVPEDLPLNDLEKYLDENEASFLEYWNGWDIDDDPKKQFELSQEAAVALLVATVQPGTHAYDFFIVHLLTTSHAVRILLPFLPPQYHVTLVREWWLLVVAVFLIKGRPLPDPDNVEGDLKGKNWKYVEDRALNSAWSKDAHYVKGTDYIFCGGVIDADIDGYSNPSNQGGSSDMGRCTRALSSSCSDLCRQLPWMGSLVFIRTGEAGDEIGI